MKNTVKNKKYDCFISHASEDKETFVSKLAENLTERGLNVWYDEYELTIGDSLRESIDKGLKDCACGLVVLSKSFFEKNWTSHELNGLMARQNSNGQKIILPIWHDISRDDVLDYSPTLADLVSANSKSDIETLTRQIKKKIEKIKNSNSQIDADENIIKSPEEAIEKYENELKGEKTEAELLALLETFIVDKKYRIKLSKLVNSEVEKLITILKSDFEGLNNAQPDNNLVYSKMLTYDTYCERTTMSLINGFYWDDNNNDELWLNSFKKIFNSSIVTSGYESVLNLQFYPALIVYYGLFLVAVLKKRYDFIYKLVNCICYANFHNENKKTALLMLYPFNIIDKNVLNNSLGKIYHTPLNDHLHDILKVYFENIIPIDAEYSDLFDFVEYFIRLQFGADMLKKDKDYFWAFIENLLNAFITLIRARLSMLKFKPLID